MRLFDELIHPGVYWPDDIPEPDERFISMMHEGLSDAVVLSVEETTNYLAELGDKKRGDIKIRDMHCLVPPFPSVWIEGVKPTRGEWS